MKDAEGVCVCVCVGTELLAAREVGVKKNRQTDTSKAGKLCVESMCMLLRRYVHGKYV